MKTSVAQERYQDYSAVSAVRPFAENKVKLMKNSVAQERYQDAIELGCNKCQSWL
jgi:hypothetical protein